MIMASIGGICAGGAEAAVMWTGFCCLFFICCRTPSKKVGFVYMICLGGFWNSFVDVLEILWELSSCVELVRGV